MYPQKYPIGESSFRAIREGGWLYVDKTADMYRLVNENTYLFLSRPRRFGKSLLVSTLQEYFRGNRHLFDGLAIDSLDPEPWPEHAVLHIDFNAQMYMDDSALPAVIDASLNEWETIYGRSDTESTIVRRFIDVIDRAYKATGRGVVVLIDEYDKPILDCMDRPELMESNRQLLRSFYGAMKSTQGHLRFVLLTGVGKMGNMNVFSGLNNIRDISMLPDFSTICGITEEELRQYFGQGIKKLADYNDWSENEAFALLKKQYDGYHFARDLKDVYNPYSVLNAIASREIDNYWYRTGTPTHLVNKLRKLKQPLSDLNDSQCTASLLADTNVMDFDPVPLMFYTGYLTIKSYDREFRTYRLGYPNEEVTQGFFRNLLPLVSGVESQQSENLIVRLVKLLREGDLGGFFATMRCFFAGFPYDLVTANEFHYQDVLYCICKLLGFYVQTEYKTSQGRIDMILATDATVYIMEFKLDGTAEDALGQIENRNYHLPWADDGRKIVKVGVNFSRTTRTIERFIVN